MTQDQSYNNTNNNSQGHEFVFRTPEPPPASRQSNPWHHPVHYQQQQQHFHYQQHPYWASPNMGDENPRPSTSTGAPRRTDTNVTTTPLTEQEYSALTAQLNDEVGVGASTINRLLEPGPGGSRAVDNWSFDSQVLNDSSAAPLTSSDTLERNPGFVNPNDLTNGSNDSNMEEEDNSHSRPGPSGVGAGVKQMVNVKVEQTANQVIFFNPDAAAPGEHNYVTVVEEHPVTAFEAHNIQQQQMQIVTVAGGGPGGGGVVSSPTCANPTHDTWKGQYDFAVTFLQYGQSTKNKSWDYSEELNKLFIDMGKPVQVGFSAGVSRPDGLLIRALPVYAEASYLKDPVKRCPNHASLSDASNKDFPKEFVDHLIRVNHDAVVYERDETSDRLSVVMPFEQPQVGVNYCTHLVKFMCLGSDVGGINRRPVRVIFTLETEEREVVGRFTVDVRICSCPKRDRQQEESKHQVTQKRAAALAEGLARSNSVFTKPSAKKKKTDIEEFVMIPVAKADFEKLNEFAESAVCMRNPDKIKDLKEQRRKLLDMHNRKYLNKPTAK